MSASWKQGCSFNVISIDSIWSYRNVTVFNIFVHVLQKGFILKFRFLILRHNSFWRPYHISKTTYLFCHIWIIFSIWIWDLCINPWLRLLINRGLWYIILYSCNFYMIIRRCFHASILIWDVILLSSRNQPILTCLMLRAGASRFNIIAHWWFCSSDLRNSKTFFRSLWNAIFVRAFRNYHILLSFWL